MTQRAQRDRLRVGLGLAPLELPYVFADEIGPAELELLADAAGAVDLVNVAEILDGKRVCVCGGSGGVGKTTTSAAIALGMAARGAKVAVVTIDPAKRLANALGPRGAGQRAAARRARRG